MRTQESLLEFISSNGTLIIDEKGNVNHEESDLSDWLNTIKKVDMEELDNYYKIMNHNFLPESGDVLDFGYWDKQDRYHPPSRDWRYDTFHNPNQHERTNELLILKAYKWIEKNRTF